MTVTRQKWSAARLAYSAEQRSRIMETIQWQNRRETNVLDAVPLKYPEVRLQIRNWFRARWLYLITEYEKVLPHIDELP